MKVIESPININYCGSIPTEETIQNLLIRDNDNIGDDFHLLKVPLAEVINKYGIALANKILKQTRVLSGKRIIVCQHIFVNHLTFESNDIVFTPHASVSENFLSIPHYAVNYNEADYSDRINMFSFLGSITTHWTRKKLVSLYPNSCFDSGVHWGLDIGMSENFNNRYRKMLSESIFSLCPRGTGISSVRIFESMASGAFPVFIADGYLPPLKNLIEWDRIAVFIPENGLEKIPDILDSMLDNMDWEYLKYVYSNYFSNEKLHKSLILNIENEYSKNR